MKYLENTTDENAERSESKRIKKIHEKVCRIRKSEKAGIKYMQRWEELEYAKQDGREEGIKEGIKENALNTAKRMLEDGKLTIEKIAEYAGLPLDEVKRL